MKCSEGGAKDTRGMMGENPEFFAVYVEEKQVGCERWTDVCVLRVGR